MSLCNIEFINDFKNEQINDEDLIDQSELSCGNGGIVFLAKHKFLNVNIVKKLIHLEVRPAIRNQILRELTVLHECNSPYIVGFYGAYTCEGEIKICMEYMDGGSLDLVLRKVNRIPENILAKITESVLMGLEYLKECHGLIHKNLKPSNILLNSNGQVKLSDIEINNELKDKAQRVSSQFKSYLSPEKLETNLNSSKCDVWSLGLILVEMATGKYPFSLEEELSIFEILENIINKPVPSLPSSEFSIEFIQFIDMCLNKDPQQRPDLNTLLNHSFILNYKYQNNEFLAKWIHNIK
ncbi:unnamed protein product [Brachionus calyciflorus]|uniref:Protein kinase domain-containing protein n=1 Tax=Brachionus calyciflorus TaxID=104777 RepID=A0A813MU99_9BILA|nr:unnamed protein product [Brachionus calyciflorus]